MPTGAQPRTSLVAADRPTLNMHGLVVRYLLPSTYVL